MAYLAKEGFDAKYGARPLRRVIQRLVEDTLSEELISGTISLGDTVQLRMENDHITVSRMDQVPQEEAQPETV